jgi:hypothetical protein
LALGKRALLAMGARYQVVGLGSAPAILKHDHWRCTNDGTLITSEDEYGCHVFLHPSHMIVSDSSS